MAAGHRAYWRYLYSTRGSAHNEHEWLALMVRMCVEVIEMAGVRVYATMSCHPFPTHGTFP